jgi:hypothetical protein
MTRSWTIGHAVPAVGDAYAARQLGIPQLIIASGAEEISSRPGEADSPVQVWRDEQGTTLASCYTLDGQRRVDVPGIASFRFGVPFKIVTASPITSVRPEVIEETYCRAVLPMVLQACGTEVLHASAVHTEGVVALCGTSGVGKSTIAFALSRRGHRLWADDAVAIDLSGPAVVALPLPFEMRLRPRAAALFGVEPQATGAPSCGRPMDQADKGPAPLAALCLLSRGEEERRGCGVRMERLRPSAALPALLAHAYCFSLEDPGLKRAMIQRYMELAARMPVFALRFRPGLELLPWILDEIEEVARSSA